MNYLGITRIENFLDESVLVGCSSHKADMFQFVYRAGNSVSWNDKLSCFEAISRERGFSKAFQSILSAVQSEIGLLLKLSSKTKYEGLTRDNLVDIIFDFFNFQVDFFPSYEFVKVEGNGSVRELRIDERLYLKTSYKGIDGDRPNIISTYKPSDEGRYLAGFCNRNQIPSNIQIGKPNIVLLRPNLFEQMNSVTAKGYKIDFQELDYLEKIAQIVSSSD